MSIQEEIAKQHFANAGEAEKRYLIKEPTGKSANHLLTTLFGSNLTAIQIKGCLDHARYLVDFWTYLPKEKK